MPCGIELVEGPLPLSFNVHGVSLRLSNDVGPVPQHHHELRQRELGVET